MWKGTKVEREEALRSLCAQLCNIDSLKTFVWSALALSIVGATP